MRKNKTNMFYRDGDQARTKSVNLGTCGQLCKGQNQKGPVYKITSENKKDTWACNQCFNNEDY